MKKLLLLSVIALLTYNCEKEKEEGCKCTAKVANVNGGYYYIQGVPTDCQGRYTVSLPIKQGDFVVGFSDCK
jgi:formylmethanofuran:tetrahydromethanopterin formyltransferase